MVDSHLLLRVAGRPRRMFLASVICLPMAVLGTWSVAARSAESAAGETPPDATLASPPMTIPEAPQPLVRPRLCYLAGGSTWNLSSEEFWQFLADYPKALLYRCPARHESSDSSFHYYRDFRMDREWAFERAPENDFFVKRAVWSRKAGDTTWQLQTKEATLATPW